jgi:hypothetical protein
MVSGPDKDKPQVRSGKVRHEPGGRAIWEWAIESGRHAIDSTSRLLKKLDITSLRVLGDDEKPWKDEGGGTAGRDPPAKPEETKPVIPTFGGPRENDPLGQQRKSFNPYDSRSPTGRGAAPPSRPAAAPRPRITQPVRPAKKPGVFARMFGKGRK